ncbi:LysR family transcriptional regulator [Streptomyces sp. NPDC018045]|uniref:LysR family transcriptional regulator n=1 Tax=Streptomyces sp. NPDC018045 TaxID=3365037 RepID=UPI0037A4D0CA
MLSWERLRVFAAVAEHGSIRAAAEKLHVTGPAISQHLRRLEREAGCKLVEPSGRGIRLTHAGRVLASSAQKMSAVAAHATMDLAAVSGLIAGPLRIGAVASALRSLIPRSLVALTGRHPRLAPEVRDGEAAHMLPELHTGNLDAVVMESWTHAPTHIPPGTHTHTLVHEQALLAVHPRHPLAHLQEVPLDSLHDLTWASCPPGSDAHQALEQLLRRYTVSDAEVRYCVADYTTQLELVAAGLTTALVPRMAAPAGDSRVRLIPCRPAVTRTIAVATAQTNTTPAVHAFVAEMARTAHTETR